MLVHVRAHIPNTENNPFSCTTVAHDLESAWQTPLFALYLISPPYVEKSFPAAARVATRFSESPPDEDRARRQRRASTRNPPHDFTAPKTERLELSDVSATACSRIDACQKTGSSISIWRSVEAHIAQSDSFVFLAA